jgi:hypothetical protein
VQRTLWLACADGVYGAPGRALLTHRLADFLAEPASEDAAERGRWAELVRGVAAAPAGAAVPSELAGHAELTEPLSAATRLSALRASIERGLSPDASAAAPPEVADLISTLIEEGAPEELPLLDRARELRQVIETGAATAWPSWRDEAGPTMELLRSDAFGTRPGAREVALRAGVRWLTGVADDLAARAAVAPPGEVTVRIGGTPVRVRRSGPASLADAEENIERTQRLSERPERAGLATAAAGVALIGVGAAASVVLIVLGVPAIIAGGAVWYAKRRERLAAAGWVEEEKARMRARAEQAARALDAHHAERAHAAAAAAADRNAIKAALLA